MKTGNKILPAVLCVALALGGCSAQSSTAETTADDNKNTEASIIQVDTSAFDLEYSNRETNAEYDESSATKIDLSTTSTTTISSAGTYIISGTAADGQILVNAGEDDKVQLVLSGVDLTCNSGPCLNVQQADKVFVTLATGTTNTFSDGSGFTVGDEDDADSTIYSTADICFNGYGSLKVNATAGHGIHSKDDVIVTGGTYEITSAKTGIFGKDCVKIKDGTFTITSQTDCIKSNKDDDDSKGFVSFDGGTFTLKSTDKGIQAAKLVRLAGGNFTIESDDDTVHSDSKVLLCGANLNLAAGDDAVHANDQLELNAGNITVSKCYEGLEAYEITVSGGTTEIHATDDGVNAAQSNSSSDVTEDENGDAIQNTTDQQTPPELPSGEAPSGQGEQNSQNGKQSEPPAKPEGDASSGNSGNQQQMTPPSDGQQPQENQDGQAQKPEGDQDPGAQAGGQMPEGQQPQGGEQPQGGGGGNAGPGASQGASLAITGGTLTVYAANGDCVDSNGSILMSGGTVTLVGPSNDGNSALDFDGTGTITGGTFFAIGSSGMAQNFGSTSTQASVAANASGSAGDVVSVTDASGSVIVSFTSNCNYSYVQASASNITEGQTYKILANGTELASANATSNQSSGIAPGGQNGGGGKGGAQGGNAQNAQSGAEQKQNTNTQTSTI